MKTGILLLGFGEPGAPAVDAVVPFLERIFLANARLEGSTGSDDGRARARALAARRAPELLEDLRRIGGSPLNAQIEEQASRLGAELERRGRNVAVAVGLQFTDPGIPEAVERLAAAGVARIVALPTYPLSGPSTTLAVLAATRRAAEARAPDLPLHEIAGWHAHPAYTALRAEGVRAFCDRRGLALEEPGTVLVLAAHGTPLRYLDEGSRYDRYAHDHARRLAAALGVSGWVLGFQNHTTRPGVAWTEPEIGRVIREVDAERVVVVPISFMQEHSETLADLDVGLRAAAEARGLRFHRVPVPHDASAFARLLADLVSPWLGNGARGPGYAPCLCRPAAVCLVGC